MKRSNPLLGNQVASEMECIRSNSISLQTFRHLLSLTLDNGLDWSLAFPSAMHETATQPLPLQLTPSSPPSSTPPAQPPPPPTPQSPKKSTPPPSPQQPSSTRAFSSSSPAPGASPSPPTPAPPAPAPTAPCPRPSMPQQPATGPTSPCRPRELTSRHGTRARGCSSPLTPRRTGPGRLLRCYRREICGSRWLGRGG